MINKMDLNNKAISIRHLLCEDELSPIDVFSLSQTIQTLSLVFYPLGKNISGTCFKVVFDFLNYKQQSANCCFFRIA